MKCGLPIFVGDGYALVTDLELIASMVGAEKNLTSLTISEMAAVKKNH